LFGHDKPRIVDIEGISIEAEPGPHVLYVRNQDKPGFIGNLGRTLGDAGVNIATFHLGRTAPGEDAICLVAVDQPLTEAILAKVRAIPLVVKARALRF
ncbi:MAG TPA: ACT domain-containing protein, partial [Alphaproteobacteria bacterium]|nr:ACT domain-containing protein [Alphaproteobacteria bacterium]